MGDLEAGERFYSGPLGLPVVERWSSRGGAIWLMAGDRTRIGLWGAEIGHGGGRGGVDAQDARQLPGAAFGAAIHRLRFASLEGIASITSTCAPLAGRTRART